MDIMREGGSSRSPLTAGGTTEGRQGGTSCFSQVSLSESSELDLDQDHMWRSVFLTPDPVNLNMMQVLVSPRGFVVCLFVMFLDLFWPRLTMHTGQEHPGSVLLASSHDAHQPQKC